MRHVPDRYPVPRRSPPFTVHLAAWVMYLVGLLVGLAAAAVFTVAEGATGTADGLPRRLIDGGLPAAAGLAAGALCWLAVGGMVHSGRRWARLLVLALSTVSILGGAWQLRSGSGTAAIDVGRLAVSTLLLVSLNTTAARGWFHPGTLPAGAAARSGLIRRHVPGR